MADIHIRGVDDSLLWALKRKATEERITLKQLVVPILEMAVNSKPVEKYLGIDYEIRNGTPVQLPRKQHGCPECGSLSGHQKGCKQ